MTDTTFSYRFVDGVANAASWTAIIAILLTIFPTKTASVLSWTEVLTGLGYMLGKLLLASIAIIQNTTVLKFICETL